MGAINFGFIQNGADTGAVGTKVVISLGAITLLNAFFNCLVLCKHPAFKGGAVAESKPLSDEVCACPRCLCSAIVSQS